MNIHERVDAAGRVPILAGVSRIAAWFLVLSVYVLAAASSYSGYFAKWAFQDDNTRASYTSMLTRQAARPFVYRQLIPTLSKMIADAIPESRREDMVSNWASSRPISSIYGRAKEADIGVHAIEYHVTYLLCFGFWLGALLTLARVCLDATGDIVSSLAAPLIFALIYPILLTRGGFFYDPVEMFFLSVSLLLATRGWILALLLITPVATLNKESFLFWLPCLWCLFPASVGVFKRSAGVVIAVTMSGATYLAVKMQFATNPGGAFEFHFLENLNFYLTPSSYFRREFTYGLALPAGVSLINLLLVVALIHVGWPEMPGRWKRHLACALIINVPLFLMLCWLDELRNLSYLFVAFTVLIACALRRVMPGSASRPPGLRVAPAFRSGDARSKTGQAPA